MIVTLTGASAAGKTTIENGLRKRLDIRPVVSHTTRPPRESDLSGNYAHVSEAEFKRMKEAGEFIWSVFLFGNYYGTAMKSLEETALEPDTIFLMLLEPDSVRTLRLFSDRMNIKTASFYIISPLPDVLRDRLQKRGDKPEQIEKRITESAKWDENALKSNIPYIFVKNEGPVEEAVGEILRTIELFKKLSSKIYF